MVRGVSFLGEVVNSIVKALIHPASFRGTSVVYHIESFAFRSLPIIVLISFLVGCIVAQQGIFQLQQVRRDDLRRRSRRHPVLRELARAADLDHGRRPLGLRDHRRDSAR